jgi:hypothetical protein
MGNLRRLCRGLLRAFTAFLIVLTCSWFALYFAAVHERRKAEHYLSDLKSFPFGSATFVDVRDLTVRHGGTGLQSVPPRFPPTCTARHCTFAVTMRHPLLALSLEGRPAELFYSALPFVGIRPWAIHSELEVNGNRLERSLTQVEQLRRGKLQTYEGLLPIEYEIRTDRDLDMNVGSRGYAVGPPDAIEGPPQEVWLAWVNHAPDAPMSRVFDLNLGCFTAIWHGCSGYQELAPSAWADYQASYNEMKTDGPGGQAGVRAR